MSTDLPLLLLQGFRVLIDGLHAELARQGHPDVRPVHGFVLQAVADGCSAVELGRRLGVTKQGATKHVETLEGLGYLRRDPDPHDARARIVRRTARGDDCLRRSARILGDLREGWAESLGPDRVDDLEHDLRAVTADAPLRVDVPGWLGL